MWEGVTTRGNTGDNAVLKRRIDFNITSLYNLITYDKFFEGTGEQVSAHKL